MPRKHRLTQQEINQQKFIAEYNLKQHSSRFHIVFPEVKSCVIKYYAAVDLAIPCVNKTEYIQEINTYLDSSRITIECLNPDCTKGYFDLTDLIHNMVNHKQEKCEGIEICKGYQDAERIYQYHCLCKSSYCIEIVYKE